MMQGDQNQEEKSLEDQAKEELGIQDYENADEATSLEAIRQRGDIIDHFLLNYYVGMGSQRQETAAQAFDKFRGPPLTIFNEFEKRMDLLN